MKIFQKKWVKLLLLLAFCGMLIASVYLDIVTLWSKEAGMEEQKEGLYQDSLIFKDAAVARDVYAIEDFCEVTEEMQQLQDKTICISDYAFTGDREEPIRTESLNVTWKEFLKSQGIEDMNPLAAADSEMEEAIISQWGDMSGKSDFVRISGKEFAELLDAISYEQLYSEEERTEFMVRLETEGEVEYGEEVYTAEFYDESAEETYRYYVETRLDELLSESIDFDWEDQTTYWEDIKFLRLYKSGDAFLIYDEKEGVLIGNRMQKTRLSEIEKNGSIYLLMENISEDSGETDWEAAITNGFTSSLAEQLYYELFLDTGELNKYMHYHYLKSVEIYKDGQSFINLGETDDADVCISFTGKEELAYVFGENSNVYMNGYDIYLYYDESYFNLPEEKLSEFLYNDYMKHGDRTMQAVAASAGALILGILVLVAFVPPLWNREKEKLRDRVLLEVNILFTIAVITGCCLAICGIFVLLAEVFLLYFNIGGVMLGGAILGELLVLLGIAALYQLISTIIYRVRKRCFLKSWLAGRFVYWIYTKIKRVVRNIDILIRRVLCLAGIGSASFLAMLILCICAGNTVTFIGIFGMFCYIVFMIGFSYVFLKDAIDNKRLLDGCNQMKNGMFDKKIEITNLYFDKLELAEAINTMGEGLEKAVSTSMKDERMKAELITNVSHDIKTPLTSIINYVDLLKREGLTPEEQQEYLKVLDLKSQRLKQLIEDLIEVSKTNSGNIELQMEKLDFKELLNQAIGEFEEKLAERNLELVVICADHKIQIWADGRRCYRILENLFSNVYKYAMPHTRVYVDLQQEADQMVFTLKNISEAPLNVAAEELMERFVRGDVSRSTSGSGLGLSIAQNLVKLQQGRLEIKLDGDLFKVEIRFPIVQ